MPERRTVRLASLLLLAVLGSGCDDGRPAGPCSPGDTESCACPAGVAGVRVCRFDQTLSPCLCGGADAGTSADAGTPADAGAATDAGASGGRYFATPFATALDRLGIFKADADRDLCFALILVAPATGGVLPISVPSGWGVERAWVAQGAARCGELFPSEDGGPPVVASAGSGQVTWALPDAGFGFPCVLDVDVSLGFPQSEPWVPGTEGLRATGIDTGACP